MKIPAAIVLTLLLTSCATAQNTVTAAPPPDFGGRRATVFISDLHWGMGKSGDGKWENKEDFRWQRAFAGFLERISAKGRDEVDLVVVGDLLDLWQPVKELSCASDHETKGCTVGEMKKITAAVLRAHKDDMKALGDFARRGANRLIVLPGNHDVALTHPEVWKVFSDAISLPPERLIWVREGTWVSADGRVVADHGHQIGRDANKYKDWPKVTMDDAGTERFVRTWGERFVQKIFNDEEEKFPIIDNFQPESLGLGYRFGERGFAGSAKDMASFFLFNLFQTSGDQLSDVLGAGGKVTYDLKGARDAGSYLVIKAMPTDDPVRKFLESDDQMAIDIRRELKGKVAELSDDELTMYCARIGLKDNPCNPTLGSLGQSILVPRRQVVGPEVAKFWKKAPFERMEVFVYGHTHRLEAPWPYYGGEGNSVLIMNIGAFQRILDKERYEKLKEGKEKTPEISLDDMNADYLFGYLTESEGRVVPHLGRWKMEENGGKDEEVEIKGSN